MGRREWIKIQKTYYRASRKPCESFTVYGGFDKDRKPEIIEVTLHKGDCACVCGKTGSGKTRLLEDIEYLAFGDSPLAGKCGSTV